MKQNILFILPWIPYPLTSGGHQALFNGIAAIKDDFNIYVTYPAWESNEYREAEKGFLQKIPEAHLMPLMRVAVKDNPPFIIRALRKIKRIIYGFLNYPPKNSSKKQTGGNERWWINTISPLAPDFLEHIHHLCQEHSLDLIQVEMPWMVSAVLTLPDNVKRVFVHHELGFVRRELEIKNISGEYAKACKKFADFNEIAQTNLYDAIITLSSIDAQKLKENGVACPIYSSFAVVNSSSDLDIQTGNGKLLTFMGPDRHGPNFVGITWFLENCWEKLKECDPEYKLNIIGLWSEQHIREYSEKYPDISFLGYVPNLQSVLKGTVMIVPITVGSGIRMKILEACSNGIPFVSTTVGAEGIPVESGRDCFITDSPEEFVEDIIRLKDPELQRQLILNANKTVREHYSLEALRRNRMAIYGKVLNN